MKKQFFIILFAFFCLVASVSLTACGKESPYDFDNTFPSGTADPKSSSGPAFSDSVTDIGGPGKSSATPTPTLVPESGSVVTPITTAAPQATLNLQPVSGSADTGGSGSNQTGRNITSDRTLSATGTLPAATSSPSAVSPTPAVVATAVPAAVSTLTPAAATAVSSSPAPAVIPTANPTATPLVYSNEVKITKSPTSETVYVGGSALFIARADNQTSINWILVSPDAKTVYRAGDASYYFSGVTVEGQGTSNLRLGNIPLSMNGWRVQCYFTGEGGPKYTSGAYLTVLNQNPVYTYYPGTGTTYSTESLVSSAVQNFGKQLYSVGCGYSYSVSDILNYSYSNGSATFSMAFTNSSCALQVVGQFKCSYSNGVTSISPQYVYYYSPTTGQLLGSENISGKTTDYFTSVLYVNAGIVY